MRKWIIVALLAALLLASCTKQTKRPVAAAELPPGGDPREQVVAVVNGVSLYAPGLNLGMVRGRQGPPGGAEEQIGDEAARAAAVQTLIENELLYQEAKRRGFTAVAEEVDKELATIEAQFPGTYMFEKALEEMNVTREDLRTDLERGQAVDRMIGEDIEPAVSVSAADTRAYYDQNPQRFTEPERVRPRQIFLKVTPETTEEQKAEMRRTLEGLRKRALAGEDFAALAEEHSQDPMRGEGGDLGFIARGQTNRDFERAFFDLQPGQLSGVVTSVYGYHLLQVVERQAPVKHSYERVKEGLAEYLRKQKVDEAVGALIKELRAKAEISIP